MPIHSINPHNQQLTQSFPEAEASECLRIIEKVSRDQKKWCKRSLKERIACVRRLARDLRNGSLSHAKMITSEMGKVISESKAEVEKCAYLCDYYADSAELQLSGRTIQIANGESIIKPEPMGIVLAIMPWNFPYWQVFRAAIPAILAGNGFLLKHASNTTSCAMAIEAAFQGEGFPMNIFRMVPVSGKNSSLLIAHPDVSAITFTGSNEAGEKIAGLAGTQIKKTVLELGGSDPAVVLKDAHLERAVTACVTSRMLNAGQSCIAAKRILVHESIANDFIELAKERIESIKVGDPMDETNEMGPLSSEQILADIDRQVSESILMGAKCICGGKKIESKGNYYAPTLLTSVASQMPVWKEETFGPVMCVTTFKTDEEAIQFANDTQWGLGASVFSQDTAYALQIAENIDTGTCSINDFVKSDPKVPFGGIKKSGYGRELSAEGILEFTNIKAYNITK